MKNIIINIFLLWGMIQDIKTYKINSYYLRIGGIIAFVIFCLSIWRNNFIGKQWLISLLPGLIFLVIAKITKEKIGYGDGYVLLILGSCFLNIKIWKLLEVSILLITSFTIIMLAFKKITTKDKIPFLPFLWLSHLLLWGMEYV
ncbi:MAG: hypothetical protein IKW30_04130 [Lachnospiraceae bacterium]|nr:hypothetical protein [Lachnospiraceae bacterium]